MNSETSSSEHVPELTRQEALEGVEGMDADTFEKALRAFLSDPENAAWLHREMDAEGRMQRQIRRQIRDEPDADVNPRIIDPDG